MEDNNEFKQEFDSSFKNLIIQVENSFVLMDKHPEKKDEIIKLWKDHIQHLVSHTFKCSEKYNNRDVLKAVTKVLVFGK